MTNIVVVTPENWYDIPRLAGSGEAVAPLTLSLTDSEGRCPLAGVPLGELRAVHQTFGSWWSALGGGQRPASLKAGEYDRFLLESRALLKQRAEAALEADGMEAESAPARLRFPGLAHPLLAESPSALAFLRSFLALGHSASLIEWARELAAGDDASGTCRADVWLRLLLQKVSVEDEVPEALACLRSVYGGSEPDRQALLAAELRMLKQCDLPGLQVWARSLGLNRMPRTHPGFDAPGCIIFRSTFRPTFRTTAQTAGEPDVTVLVPSYCHAEFIEAALASVLAQTHSGYRLLVVDDHSSDGTVERASRVRDPRLRITVNDTNLGLGDSVLRALATIDTPLVALLNSDDLFYPERLERCREILEASPDAQVVATSIVPIDADARRVAVDNVSRLIDGRKIADWIQWFAGDRPVGEGADLVAELLERNFLITSSNIVCRTEFLRSRAHSLRGLKYCFDWQLFLDAALDRALVYLPEELLGYRLHGANTVWFDDDERQLSYGLEVNRVLARTLRDLRQRLSVRPDGGDPAGILELLTNHAVKHSEARPTAMYSAELLGGRELGDISDRSEAVRHSLRSMFHPNGTALVAAVRGNETGGASRVMHQESIATAARAIADVFQEEAIEARGQERSVRDELNRHQVERQQAEADLGRQIAAMEVERREGEAALRRQIAAVDAERQQGEAELRRQIAAVEAERQQGEADFRRQIAAVEAERQQGEADFRRQIAAAEVERQQVEADLRRQIAAAEVERQQAEADFRRQLASVEAERQQSEADFRRQIAAVEAERQQGEADFRRQLAAAEVERQQSEAELRRQITAVQVERQHSEAELRREIATLEVARSESDSDFRRQIAAAEASAAAETKTHAEEIARLRSSPEWLVGDRVWNRAGLSRIGRLASPALRTFRDRRNRWGLAGGRAARQIGLTRPRAVVASCWAFPIHSHTFVYEEMQALAWAGLNARVFCCDTNSKSELPPAFERLWRTRVVLESDWTFNRRDLDHFRRTRPDRVDALLARLSEATGLTPEALLQQSIVTMGFTFARHIELSGAEYLHTYFFYDQSFLALMAAYLLRIPRGVTAYADHMLSDYAFKCVSLHLELADIIVATSQRIRNELSAIGGGRFDAKIIVKPNGIDTARFPYVDGAARLKIEGEPELVAVNRIEPKKGLIYLVEAIGILNARGVAARLNIVGGTDPNAPATADCLQQLIAKIEELQLSDRVVLHGIKPQPEFAPLLARSRIFVAPYVEVASGDKDGIPTAVLEAMSTGLPVVATDAGSIAEAVADGVEGLSVPQRDPVRLADAIERLLTDRALYLRLSEGARRRAVSEFDAHVTETGLHERIQACLKASSRS